MFEPCFIPSAKSKIGSAVALAISIREFARRDGCSEKLVRRGISTGHLKTLADGKLDETLVGSAWRKGNRNADIGADKGADSAPSVRTPSKPSAPNPGGEGLHVEIERQPHGGALKRTRKDDPDPDEDLEDLGDDVIAQILRGEFVNVAKAEMLKANALALRQTINARREAGALVEIELAERVLFESARAIREAWLNWPLRAAPLIAAELDVPADKVVEVLTAHVHEQLATLGEPEADFSA
jgi:hypothetical protein